MLYISLVVSFLFFVITLIAVWQSKDVRRTYLKTWFGLPFGYLVMCVLPTYFLHALLTATAATICCLAGARRRTFAYAAIAAFLVSYGVVGIPRAVELWQLSGDYAFDVLDQRLAYEPGRPNAPVDTRWNRPFEEAPELGTVWEFNRYPSRRRERALEDLHSGCVNMFVNASGFGVARMYPPSAADISKTDPIRDAAPFALPEPSQPGEGSSLSAGDLALAPSPEVGERKSVPGREDLQMVHRQTAGDFLNPLAFGYVRDRQHAAGFISHRLTKYPPKPDIPNDEGHWRLEFLDLVSLLKHPEPVAYVSKHLPRMDELRDAPTRPLDEFEADGLAKLHAGEELTYAHGPRRVRILGALRARDECLKCHSVNKGELLGAFSYDLRRDVPLPPLERTPHDPPPP
jgi:hypothetical protein